MLFGSVGFGTRSWERSIARGDLAETIQAVQLVLRRELEAAYPAWRQDGSGAGQVNFDGTAKLLRFRSVPPSPIAPAAYQDFTLDLTAVGQLRLRWQRHFGGDEPSTTERVLLDGVSSLDLAYFGADRRAPLATWRSDWRNQPDLPQLIRLRVALAGTEHAWPELIIHPRLSVDTGCVYDPVSRACRGR
jgi:general secretion pathway protein J